VSIKKTAFHEEAVMFTDSLLETSWAQRSRRSWTTLTSFALQATMTGILLLIPLIRPIAIPFLKPLATPVMLAAPPGPPPSVQSHATERPAESNLSHGVIIMPPTIPNHIKPIQEESGPPQVSSSGPYVFGSTGSGSPERILHALGNSGAAVVPPPPPAVVHPLRVSRMSEGDLVRKVQPTYPPLARSARIQGQVVLAAIISKEGTIENLRALAGHPMLVHAALEAVSQWRYRPYILNNEPVEVETQITVNFSLSGN
jgi:periplasmic protein TonB